MKNRTVGLAMKTQEDQEEAWKHIPRLEVTLQRESLVLSPHPRPPGEFPETLGI